MADFTVTSVSGNVANISGAAGTGTVTAAFLDGAGFTRDDTVSTNVGSASKNASGNYELQQDVLSFEVNAPYEAPNRASVEYTPAQLGIPDAPDLRSHRDEDGGHIEASDSWKTRYFEWSAEYNSNSTIETGPEDGTFNGSDSGAPWTVDELGGSARRAARYVDWHDRTPNLAADPDGQYNTASSVTLASDDTYFGRGPARRGSGAGQDPAKFYCKTSEGWLEEYTAGELGLVDPPEQELDEMGDGVEVGFDEEFFDPRETDPDAPESAVGVQQQLRICVPNVYTQMTLGTAYPNNDGQGFAYPGFGVQTGGHVFISAGAPGKKGDVGQNRMKLQSKGDMSIFAAEGGLNMGGLGGMMLGSAGSTIMAADGGVLISGGVSGGFTGANDGYEDLDSGKETVEIPKWIDTQSTVSTVIGSGLAAYDAWIGLTGAKLGMKRSLALGMTDKPATVKNVALAAGVGLLGVGASAVGALTGLAGAFFEAQAPTVIADAIAGTTIWGQSGWIGATLNTMGLYSGAGTCIHSVTGVSILAGAVGIDAKKELEVSGKTGQFKFDTGVDIVSGKGMKLSGRGGSVELVGADIAIGSLHKVGKQSATGEISVMGGAVLIGARDGASLMTDTNAHVEGKELASIAGGNVSVSASDVVDIGAPNAVNIESTKGIHLSVGKSAIHVTKSELSIAHVPSADNGDLSEMKGYLAEVEAEIKKVDDQWDAFRKQKLAEGLKISGPGRKVKALMKKLKDQQTAFQKEVAKAEKALEKNHTISVKSGGIFFKLGSHTFKVTKQGMENASLKAQK